ncbi:D-alanyl-D-alanine carboxypeptidase [Sporosarcina sp. P13]|uniref:M15 family metallopeptidase n=1 Tax=Sporosarcina sp. P13 TaxID=2048263 RepID=UPI000C172DB1|nr:M15 family metallopeptidase [Sporosarcina sp. P13]PIC65086.1 D-alanyl-D-alanine carboxypeptidase [Sporosarcina sp. P13]
MGKRGKKSGLGRNRTYIAAGFAFVLLVGAIIWIGSNDRNVNQLIESLDQGDEFQKIELSLNEDKSANHVEENPQGTNGPDEEPLRDREKVPFTGEVSEEVDPTEQSKPVQEKSPNPRDYLDEQDLPKEPKYVRGILLANKQYPLPKDFAPGESQSAREAFNELAAAAVTSGINLQAFSTYRSYDYQVTLYNRYVERDGQEAADRYSARPGYSEHQTGLAFDIGEVNHEKHWASTSFGDTEAAKWLAANAYEYGFILRYPKGKEEVTGYMHESWHYRYVGKDLAEKIFKQNITLEEYLGIH